MRRIAVVVDRDGDPSESDAVTRKRLSGVRKVTPPLCRYAAEWTPASFRRSWLMAQGGRLRRLARARLHSPM